MSTPVWRREGWRPNGPGLCICPYCYSSVSTNALARAAHIRGKRCWQIQVEREERERKRLEGRARIAQAAHEELKQRERK